jgi:hypothetical protein
MLTRIRTLACGFALGVGMLLLGATAAHATPQSGAHVSGQPGGSDSPSWSPSGGCRHHHHYCQTPTSTPTPKPKPTCTSKPTPTTPSTTSPATTPPTPLATATPTAVPTGGANTGGGGSIGGGGPDTPLVAGGAALALGSAGLGLFAYRRYRKSVA